MNKFAAYISMLALIPVAAAASVMVANPGGQPFMDGANPQFAPSIDGNILAYKEFDGSSWDVYVSNIETGITKRLTEAGGDGPSVDKGKVVYLAREEGEYHAYVYDTRKDEAIRISTTPSQWVDISGDTVVWSDNREPANANDVFAFDLKSGNTTQITDDRFDQQNPSIYKNLVVWSDNRGGNGNLDIFVYDMKTRETRQLTTAACNQHHPKISGNYVTWADERHSDCLVAHNQNVDVYAYDLKRGAEMRITSQDGPQGYPDVAGKRIAYTDFTSLAGDVFMYDIESGSTIPVAALDATQSQVTISKDSVAWADYREGVARIYGTALIDNE